MLSTKVKPSGEVFVLLATVCWSLSGVLTKSLTISPILSNAIRSFIAVFILLAYNRGKVRVNRTILLAAACGALTTTLFFISLSLTAAANAIVIQYTAPIFVLVFSCLLEKRLPTLVQMGVVVSAFTGVAVVFATDMAGGGLLGNLAALGAGITFAGVFFVNRLPGASPVDASIIAFSICALTGLFYLPQLSTMGSGDWLIMLIMGVVQHGLAYVFFSIGILRCSGFSASLIGMLETVLVPLWVFLAFGEAPTVMALTGCTLIVASVVVNTCWERAHPGR